MRTYNSKLFRNGFICRRDKRFYVNATILVSIIFIFYQFLGYFIISNGKPGKAKITNNSPLRGTHILDQSFYVPKDTFTCIKSGEVIAYGKVNDDYCDCADSSDEPGTNACPDGIFHCTKTSTNIWYPKLVPSSKVNDGICDCCDGSEEYSINKLVPTLCPDKC